MHSEHSDATTTVADLTPYNLTRDLDLEAPRLPPPMAEPSITILSYNDAERANQVALELQRQGKYREALAQYGRLINGIQEAIDGNSPYLSQADINNLKALKAILQDTCFALQQALEFGNSDDGDSMNFPGLDNANLDLQRQFSVLTCQAQYNLIFQIICIFLSIGVFVNVSNADCYSNLAFIGTILYLPIGFYGLLYGHLIKKQLKNLDNNYRNLNHTTLTAYNPNTFGYTIETLYPLVAFLKLIWFLFAMISMFKEIETCDGDENGERAYSFFVGIVVLSSLELWLVVLLCGCIPLFCCCFCALIYRVYRQHQKNKPVGMKEDALNRLESKSFHDGMFDENRDTCAICLAEFEEGDKLRLLPCSGKHAFHKECIDQWLITNDTCPQCREHLTGLVDTKENL